ncbi:phospholipid phosphatase 1-like isoform X2 [Anopheles darlingi]|uniref:phospholipid phosphatase 1-like isoform X2 n=1 Tax=Anopheles darlingi TaxID=43151 RepID=UPI0021003F4D|nr:phospholipid phosphatase 1-like isoform X2 [Anopheles darlingi]
MADVESQKICGKAKARITLPVAIDVIILTLVACFLILTELGLLPQVVKRGYYCNDQSIRHEYKGDTISTVTILLSGLVPIALIWLTEALLYTPSINCTKADSESRCRGSWREAWYWSTKYGRGLVTMLVIIGTIKIFLGELRPHFLHTCKPDVVCEGDAYITSYTCLNEEESLYFIRDASKSFPSGHSAMSMYEALFLIWYLQRRVPRLRTVLTIPLCQMILMCWAVFCSLSRITDNRHHWWDVLAGSIAGCLAAIMTCLFACRNFDATRRKRKSSSVYKDHDHKLINNSNATATVGGVSVGTPLHKEENITLNHVILA